MNKPLLDIRYEANNINNELTAVISKPNRGDEYFAYELSRLVASELAKRYIDEFYDDIKSLVDMDKVKDAIADEVVKLGIEKLKEKL